MTRSNGILAKKLMQTYGASVEKQDDGLDKFQVATCRLIDTLHGYFAGNHPTTTVDSARATCELISGFTHHLQKTGRLPDDLKLSYRFKADPNEKNPSILSNLSIELYKATRAGSNFAKHADRDADKTHSYESYNDEFNLSHLLYAMVGDYEALHYNLLRTGLLDHKDEKLYPIDPLLLLKSECYGYLDRYWIEPGYGLPDDQIAYVPAAALTCLMFYKHEDDITSRSDVIRNGRPAVAEEMRTLGLWPVDTKTSAKIVRAPAANDDLNNSPEMQ